MGLKNENFLSSDFEIPMKYEPAITSKTPTPPMNETDSPIMRGDVTRSIAGVSCDIGKTTDTSEMRSALMLKYNARPFKTTLAVTRRAK
jgi:hypothetical protein